MIHLQGRVLRPSEGDCQSHCKVDRAREVALQWSRKLYTDYPFADFGDRCGECGYGKNCEQRDVVDVCKVDTGRRVTGG